MCTNWMGFTFKAILLASLSLFLFGCGSGSSTDPPAVKSVNGVVSDSTAGQLQLSANATVTAYAVDANGNVSSTPLSSPVKSDAQGKFSLTIPASYTGGIMLKSEREIGVRVVVVRSLLASVPQNQPVTISPATEMVAQYIVINKSGKFTSDNIQKAILVLEPFFGPDFTQVPPPETGVPLTQPQLQLLTATQAIESLLPPNGIYTLAQLITVNDSGKIAMGTEPILTAVNTAIAASYNGLLIVGAISGDIPRPAIIQPVPSEPTNLSDTTAPTAPQNLVESVSNGATILSWSAATDAVGVTAYYVYRNNVLIGTTANLTYTDSTIAEAMSYTYQIKARDAVGNISAGSNTVGITTLPILTYTISGKITFNGTGLPSVYVAISGAGTGIAVTDVAGNYNITGVREGSYTITPTRTGYGFTPLNRSTIVTTANIVAIDFTATAIDPGTAVGGAAFPSGTIIGGITYPSSTVIGGITYPTATVIGGVTYPTGTVIGGITYPNGIVIGGVTYPPGTVVGGVAFPPTPPGVAIGSITYPTGVIISGVTYPSGIVIGGVFYPTGTATGSVANPNGVVIGGVFYPTGTATGSVTMTSPGGVILGGVFYPAGTAVGTATVPGGVIIGGVFYPVGTADGAVTVPGGVVIGGVFYPVGTADGTATAPSGVVNGGIFYPVGTATGSVTGTSGTVISGVFYPGGTAFGSVFSPIGVVVGDVTYQSGIVIGSTIYPGGITTGVVMYHDGAVTGSISSTIVPPQQPPKPAPM